MKLVGFLALAASGLCQTSNSFDSTGEAALKTGNVLTIPLHARAPAIRNPQHYTNRRRDGNSTYLTNVGGGSFFTRITLGSQTFDVVVDTGSDQLWVPSVTCGSNCANTSRLFDPSQSRTFKYTKGAAQSSSIVYGTGSVKGAPASDDITWGGVTCNVPFFLVDFQDSVMKNQMSEFGDGIMGLVYQGGLDVAGVSKIHSTVTYAMARRNQLPNYIFSIWLNQSSVFDEDTGVDPYGGRVIVGGTDPSLYHGSFTFLSVVPTPILYSDGTLIAPPANVNAIIDSGTSLIVIDEVTLKGIVDLLAGSQPSNFKYNSKQGLYSVNCQFAKSFPSITLVLSNIPFEIAPNDYIGYNGKSIATSTTCILGFHALKSVSDVWIIGDPFLYKYYSVFDLKNGQMGFALSSNGMENGNGVPLTESTLKQGGGAGFGQLPPFLPKTRFISFAVLVLLCVL
ncbi:aspartic peptidase domain-containing protein [Obelidium mucronatum]|nr:aspartic peptidase domain-containing protein [Obelidium mucronatum]